MSRHRKFEVQLENLRTEAGIAAQYLYADMAIQHAASKSKRLLNRLNSTPTFWIASGAAFQSAAYISLGRIFDITSKYNVNELLDSATKNIGHFQREALAARKRDGSSYELSWLDEYLDKAYYPKESDFERLRGRVEKFRSVYERVVKPARNKYLAHREKQEHAEVQALFRGGTLEDLWRLTTFLLQLHTVLWELLHNGRRPVFRRIRYSVKSIYDSNTQSTLAHESMVGEVKKLMQFIEHATPNPSSKRTRPAKPSRAAHVKR